MMAFYIQLEARDPARNILRSYKIIAGQDLFGDWVVELTYGRIGAKGRTKVVLVADEDQTAARRYVRQCLNKRKSAPKRIGVGCQVTSKPYGDPKAIQLTDVDLVAGSLQVVSYARPGKLFTANRNLIVAQVALLKPEFFKKVVEAIVDILYASFN